jgi:hypothetical protein
LHIVATLQYLTELTLWQADCRGGRRSAEVFRRITEEFGAPLRVGIIPQRVVKTLTTEQGLPLVYIIIACGNIHHGRGAQNEDDESVLILGSSDFNNLIIPDP